MTVNRFHTASLTDAEARRILTDASEVFTTDDGVNDVACPMDFQLQGAVTTFDVGDGSVDSRAEFRAVCDTGGRVHVVNDLNWCGRPSSTVIGCADTPGSCMVVVRNSDPAIEAVLWAHEFGHNQGLSHRDDTGAVMNSIIRTSHRRVSQTECDAYRGTSLRLNESESVQQPDEREQVPMDIKDFVRSRFIHGIPYEQAISYSPDVVPVLLEMLRDPQEEPYRANIIETLGMIGDARAVQPLLDLFSEGSGQLSERDFKVRKAVVLSLGYLLNKTESREAFEFLVQGLNPQFWSRAASWSSPAEMDDKDAQTQLIKMAIWGLALSGRPEAKKALETLQQTPSVGFSEATDRLLTAVAEEAIDSHSVIADQGLLNYHRK
jgi:hypothetical protein